MHRALNTHAHLTNLHTVRHEVYGFGFVWESFELSPHKPGQVVLTEDIMTPLRHRWPGARPLLSEVSYEIEMEHASITISSEVQITLGRSILPVIHAVGRVAHQNFVPTFQPVSQSTYNLAL